MTELAHVRAAPSVEPMEPAGGSASILEVISRVASDPSTDIDKIERLFAMHERMQEAESKRAYFAAKARMQAEMPDDIPERGEIRDRNGRVQSTYPLWEDVVKAIRPIMERHGFSLAFRIDQGEGAISVTAVLSHAAGHSEETPVTLPADTSGSKNAVQAVASSISYGKRYAAGGLLNLTSRGDDDDGQAAGAKTISADQYLTLRNLMDETGTGDESFAQYLRVPHLEHLPAARFSDAEAALLAKKAKLAKAEGGA